MEFLLSRYYQIVTEESARDGDHAETGTVSDRDRVTFREAVEQLREMSMTSNYPIRSERQAVGVWATSEPEIDYSNGEERTESVHLRTLSGGEVPGRIMFRLLKLANLVSH